MLTDLDIIESQGINFRFINNYIIEKNDDLIIVNIKVKDDESYCLFCGGLERRIKDYWVTTFQGLPIGKFKVLIKMKYPRYECKYCNHTYTMDISPITNYKISNELLKSIKSNFKQMKSFYDIGIDHNVPLSTVQKIFDKEIPMQLQEIGTGVCFDEFKNLSTDENFYAFIVVDLFTHKIVNIQDSRKKDAIIAYLESISIEKRLKVKYVITDMYRPYIDLAKHYFPNAIIAIDPFHYINHLTTAMLKLRARVIDELKERKQPVPSLLNWLSNHRRLFVMTIENLRKLNADNEYKYDLEEKVARAVELNFELQYAYQYYQIFMKDEVITKGEADGKKLIYNMMNVLRNSISPELKEVGATWRNFRKYIVNSFIYINDVRLTNGAIEGINSRVKTLKKLCGGYKNSNRFFKRIVCIVNTK